MLADRRSRAIRGDQQARGERGPIGKRCNDTRPIVAKLRDGERPQIDAFGARLVEQRGDHRPVLDHMRERLARLGHASGDLAADLEAWAGIENLEERVSGAEQIDPVVLEQLRKAQ